MTQWEYRIEFIDLYVSHRDPKPEIMLMLNINPPQVRPAARFVTIIQTKNSRHKSR